MQILHMRILLSPQTGSGFVNSGSSLDQAFTNIQASTSKEDTLTHRYPFLATLLSPTKSIQMTDTMDVNNLQFTNNNIRKDGVSRLDILASNLPFAETLTCNMEDGKHESSANRRKEMESDRRVQKRKRSLPEPQNSLDYGNGTEENSNGFEHSNIPYLIVNLYAGERNGFTFELYLPETADKEAVLFQESHLIPYTETYLTDCIDAEIFPDRLLSILNLDSGHKIHLTGNGKSVLCEVRDFRHCSRVNTKDNPILRHVVLKQTTGTIPADLQRLVLKSQMQRHIYMNSRMTTQQNFESELVASKRMRLNNPNYPYDWSENKTLLGADGDAEAKEELTLDQRQEFEKRMVKETSSGLCLDPSKQVGLIANFAQYERLKWNLNELKQSFKTSSRKKQRIGHPQRLLLLEDSNEFETEIRGCGKENEIESGVVRLEETAEDRNVNPAPVDNVVFQEARKSFHRGPTPLLTFINKCIHSNKLKRPVDRSQALKLLPIKNIDYSHAPALTSFEDIRALSQPADSASIRPLFSENFVTKTEEYIFETERRKHPHRTVVTIYQRNGGDNYFGELEQEALDEPTESNRVPIKPYVLDPPATQSAGSKCKFDLGSSQSVHLYVKQFTDIFTEDGRRPCKITFQKAGQPGPTVLCTSSYKTQQLLANNNSTPTSNVPNVSTAAGGGVHVGANVIIAHSGSPTPPHGTNTIIVSLPSGSSTIGTGPTTIPTPTATSTVQPTVSSAPSLNPVPVASATALNSSSPSQSNPPVQIVHPQPRLQPSIQISTASQLYAAGIQALTTSTNPVAASQTNAGRIVQQHQLLTRPKIFNVNLTSQQQQQHFALAQTQQASQLIQNMPQPQSQQNIRVKQLGVTRLLLSTTGIANQTAKPITVIQPLPQPQNHTVNHSGNSTNVNQVQAIQLNSAIEPTHHHVGHVSQASQLQIASHPRAGNTTNNPIMIMLASPATGNSITDQNAINISSGTSGQSTLAQQGGNVSLNLSAINLDGLLAVSNSSLNSIQQHPHAYVTSAALVHHSSTLPITTGLNTVEVSNAGGALNTVNIVRYSNNTGTMTVQPQVIRQNAMSVMTPQQQAAILNMNSPSATGIILSNTQNVSGTGVEKHVRLQQNLTPQFQQLQPELEEITVPDLNTLLNNSCTPTRSYRTTAKVPSIDVNLNLNLNLSGTTSVATTPAQPMMGDVYTNERQNGPSLVSVSSVDSIFNSLAETNVPDTEDSTPGKLGARASSSLNSLQQPQQNSVVTLNGLLGSPPMSASNVIGNNSVSSPMQSSPQSPSISSILSPISPNVVTSSVAYSTPRLSALLAGTPSADSSHNLLIENGSNRGVSGAGNCGNLFDRLLSQGQTVAVPVQRTGGSRLNPIATATPSVALDHPVLAATLTQGANPNLRHALTRPTTYRQIAPAPPPSLQNSTQQQQLINNLLGMIGTGAPANQALQQQAIRISKANHTSSGGSGTR